MTIKEEIQKNCSLGLSEDINGEFYTIYDFNKIYNMFIEKTEDFIRSRLPRVMNYYPTNSETIKEMLNEDIRTEYREYMNN